MTKLEEIMASEENVETFLEAHSDNELGISTEPMIPVAPSYDDLIEKGIKITHGQHGEDYVWHISPANPRQQFKATPEVVIKTIAKAMNEVIPETVTVNIHTPLQDWEIQEYTFKAIALMEHWAITDVVINRLNLDLIDEAVKLL